MDAPRHDHAVVFFEFQRIEKTEDTAAAQEGGGVGFGVNGLEVRQRQVVDAFRLFRQKCPTLPHKRCRLFLETPHRRQRPHPQDALLVDG